MAQPNPPSSRAFRHRSTRVLAAIAVGALAAMGLVLQSHGEAPSTEPNRDVPTQLTVPPPHKGDQGVYNRAVAVGTTPSQPSYQEWLAFEVEEELWTLDDHGAPVAAATIVTGPVGPPADGGRQGDLVAAGTGQFLARVETAPPPVRGEYGLPGAGLTTSNGQTMRTTSYTLPSTDDRGPLCGLRSFAQGKTLVLDTEVNLFEGCDVGLFRLAHSSLRAVDTQEIGGRSTVVLAGDATAENGTSATIHVWLAEDIAYPLLMVVTHPTSPPTFEVLALAKFGPGDGPILTGAPPGDLHPAPQLVFDAPTSWGLSDADALLTFRPSEAYRSALDHPAADRLRTFLKLHPAAAVEEAHYRLWSPLGVETTQREWRFTLADGQERFHFMVTRHVAPSLDHVPVGASIPSSADDYSEDSGQIHWDAPILDPRNLTVPLPTLGSLENLWGAYDPDRFRFDDAQSLVYWFSCADDPCTRYLVHLEVGVVRAAADAAGIASGEQPRTVEWHGLDVAPDGEVDSHWVIASHLSDMADPDLSGAEPLTHPEANRLPPDAASASKISGWRLPSPWIVAATGGATALLALLAGWLWHVVRGTAPVGLYSRVERPRVLEQPTRARLFQILEAEPGLHFQALVRRLDASTNTTEHHLRVLQAAGLVARQDSAGYACYFPKGRMDWNVMGAVPVLKSRGARSVLLAVLDAPGSMGSLVAQRSGLSRQGAHRHLRRLSEAGLVELTAGPGRLLIRPTTLARTLAKSLPLDK